VIIAAAAVGIALFGVTRVHSQAQLFAVRCLFVALPLGAFIAFARRQWTAIFRPLRGADFVNMVVFWLINLAVSVGAAFVVAGGDLSSLTRNTAADSVAGVTGLVSFHAGTFIELFGEEVFTLLPFLGVL
jgi:CAAX protease family protein